MEWGFTKWSLVFVLCMAGGGGGGGFDDHVNANMPLYHKYYP